jgi:hypothetical protein
MRVNGTVGLNCMTAPAAQFGRTSVDAVKQLKLPVTEIDIYRVVVGLSSHPRGTCVLRLVHHWLGRILEEWWNGTLDATTIECRDSMTVHFPER